jgi:hypothetical protein
MSHPRRWRRRRPGVGAEIDPGPGLPVGRHRLPQHGEIAVLRGQAAVLRGPCLARVVRHPDRGRGAGRIAARAVAVQRHDPDRIRVMGVNGDGKSEGRGQALADIVPGAPAIAAAPCAVVVLLVERVGPGMGLGRGPCCARNARSRRRAVRRGDRGGRRPRHSTGGCAAPRFAAILGREDARSRDGEPEFRGVVGVGDQRVQRQARRAGGPGLAVGELGQRRVFLPSHAAIGGGQKLRRFRPGVEFAMGMVHGPDGVEACRRRGRACPPIRSWRRNRGRRGPLIHLTRRRASTGSMSRRHRWTARRPRRASPRHPRPRSCPLAGSPVMWLIGQPPQWGPETSQSVRSSLAVRMKAPFVVPTSRCVVPDMVRLSPGKSALTLS